MIRSALLIAVVGALFGCSIEEEPPVPNARQLQSQQPAAQRPAARRDPIDGLVDQLSRTGGIWVNGISPNLDLPATAAIDEVVAAFFQKVSYEVGKTGSPVVEDIRHVTIDSTLPNDQYIAVLVTTNLGRKVLLLQYSPASGWWSRVYDV